MCERVAAQLVEDHANDEAGVPCGRRRRAWCLHLAGRGRYFAGDVGLGRRTTRGRPNHRKQPDKARMANHAVKTNPGRRRERPWWRAPRQRIPRPASQGRPADQMSRTCNPASSLVTQASEITQRNEGGVTSYRDLRATQRFHERRTSSVLCRASTAVHIRPAPSPFGVVVHS